MSQPAQDYQQPNSGYYNSTEGSPGSSAESPNTGTQYSASPLVPQTKERNKGSLIGGLVLITLGALFLADELIPQINFGDLWPVILIVIGVGLLINAVTKRNRNTNQY